MNSKSPNRLQKEVAKYKKVRDKGHKPLKIPFSQISKGSQPLPLYR